MLLNVRPGAVSEQADVRAETVAVTAGANGPFDGLQPFFALPRGKVYFSTIFPDVVDQIFHVWYRDGRDPITFEGREDTTFTNPIDCSARSSEGTWKVVAYDKDGRRVDGRRITIQGKMCLVGHYAHRRSASEACICSGVREGKPVRPELDLAPGSGRWFFHMTLDGLDAESVATLEHVWFGGPAGRQRVVPTVDDVRGIAYSSIEIPDQPFGYWKVVAFDASGSDICYRDFDVSPL